MSLGKVRLATGAAAPVAHRKKKNKKKKKKKKKKKCSTKVARTILSVCLPAFLLVLSYSFIYCISKLSFSRATGATRRLSPACVVSRISLCFLYLRMCSLTLLHVRTCPISSSLSVSLSVCLPVCPSVRLSVGATGRSIKLSIHKKHQGVKVF